MKEENNGGRRRTHTHTYFLMCGKYALFLLIFSLKQFIFFISDAGDDDGDNADDK